MEAITYVHIKDPNSARSGLQCKERKKNFCLPVKNLNYTEKRTSYSGPKMWNVLTDVLKKFNKLMFTKHLRNWL